MGARDELLAQCGAEIARLHAENAEMEACMELHRKREMAYIAEWQKVTGKYNIQPDYGRLLHWLYWRRVPVIAANKGLVMALKMVLNWLESFSVPPTSTIQEKENACATIRAAIAKHEKKED